MKGVKLLSLQYGGNLMAVYCTTELCACVCVMQL